MKLCVGTLVPVLAILISVAQGILIVGPTRMYPGRLYTVVISNFLNNSVDLSFSLKRNVDNDVIQIFPTKNVNVLSNASEVVDFNVPEDLPFGDYRITIAGTHGFEFHEDVPLVIQSKTISGLIQLNKPVYKPSDTVQFRVIVLDRDLKPPKHLPYVTVIIEASSGSKMRQWDTALLEMGVFEGSFLITPASIFGTYKILVVSDGYELVSKTFEVKEYELYGFDVHVFPTRVPVQEHKGIDLTVAAADELGHPVSGKINFKVFTQNNHLHKQATCEVNGTVNITIAFNKHLVMINPSEEIKLNFDFTERHTGRTLFKSVPITVFKSMYRAKLEILSPEIRPKILFWVVVKVQYHDGFPAKDLGCRVEVDGIEKRYDAIKTTDDNGGILLSFTVPSDSEGINVAVSVGDQEILEEFIHVTMEYKSKVGGNIARNISHQKALFKMVAKPIQLNKPIRLQAIFHYKANYLMYYVVAKGNVIDNGVIQPTKTRIQIELKYSACMVPKATMLVVVISGSTVEYHTKDIVFEEQLNDFQMSILGSELITSGSIELFLSGRPGSYVALAAYDKRLQDYGSTHDLSWQDVENVFATFYEIEPNEIDIFQSLGMFVRISKGYTIDSNVRPVSRDGQHLQSMINSKSVLFAESFLWKNITLHYSDGIALHEDVPHTMTSWYITGFAIHPEYGFGIIKHPIECTTNRVFYIAPYLPRSIKRGEIVLLQFAIVNYHRELLVVQMQLFNIHNQLDFLELPSNESVQIKSVVSRRNVEAPVSFLVKAKKLGEIVVRVEASYMHVKDTIEKVILVEPEVIINHRSSSFIFSSTKHVHQTFNIFLDIPRRAYVNSTDISFIIEPNLLLMLNGKLKNLINATSEIGEVNTNEFASKVAVLDFLTVVDPNHTAFQIVLKQLASGYLNQIRYRRSDGSFKAYGSSGSSIFVTAFVVQVLQTASKYLPEVDESIINQAFDWLASKQHRSGRFEEFGPVVMQDYQKKSQKSIALTSYVLIAFLENVDTELRKKHSNVIKTGINHILHHEHEIKNSFDLAIATYALSLYDSNSVANSSLNITLLDKWYESALNLDYMPSSKAILAYALLSMRYDENLSVKRFYFMEFLASQRYDRTFASLHDTFVVLKALAKLADMISPFKNHYDVNLTNSLNWSLKTIRVRSGDPTLMFENIPNDTRRLKIDVFGKGSGLLTVKYKCGLNKIEHTFLFNLTLEKVALKSNYELQLKICANYKRLLVGWRSNMTLVEVTFPSGYTVDDNPISNATNINPIERVDIQFGATTVVVYYTSMGEESNCFVITAYRRLKVTLRRPAYVIVKDYYLPEQTAVKVYNLEGDEE